MTTRATFELRTELLEEAYELMPTQNQRTVIEIALEEFIRNRKRKDLRDLRGKIQFEPDYNYKAMRKDGGDAIS